MPQRTEGIKELIEESEQHFWPILIYVHVSFSCWPSFLIFPTCKPYLPRKKAQVELINVWLTMHNGHGFITHPFHGILIAFSNTGHAQAQSSHTPQVQQSSALHGHWQATIPHPTTARHCLAIGKSPSPPEPCTASWPLVSQSADASAADPMRHTRCPEKDETAVCKKQSNNPQSRNLPKGHAETAAVGQTPCAVLYQNSILTPFALYGGKHSVLYSPEIYVQSCTVVQSSLLHKLSHPPPSRGAQHWHALSRAAVVEQCTGACCVPRVTLLSGSVLEWLDLYCRKGAVLTSDEMRWDQSDRGEEGSTWVEERSTAQRAVL